MVLGFKTTFNGKPTGFPEKIKQGIKIHTIRKDANKRWKVGFKIQFATGVRTKHYQQFHSGVCKGIQRISMSYKHDLTIAVDGRVLSVNERYELATSDGFDSWKEFRDWWGAIIDATEEKFIVYRLIHWTDFKY